MRDRELDQYKGFIIRPAIRDDIPTILGFIRELAEYEKLLPEVIATEELLEEWIFVRKRPEVVIGEFDGIAVGYALFFHNFSTFLGRGGIYIEDLYIKPDFRQRGFGKKFFQHMARMTLDRGCGRLEWACLDWNQPSINFYVSMGAQAMSDWTAYRLSGETLKKLAEKDPLGE
jgi:GNAT superfamily N-acetyltransferase